MGYILPIQNYQAQHYQDRVTQLPTDPIPIDRIEPKKIEMSYYSATNNQMLEDDYNQNHFNHGAKGDYEQSITSDRMNQIYADITGIGGQINYSI